jgi:hypothetical protein
MFLTNIRNNVLSILTESQEVLLKAFRQNLEGSRPAGRTRLSEAAVVSFVADVFATDRKLSLDRARMHGRTAASLSTAKKAALSRLACGVSGTCRPCRSSWTRGR